MASEPVSEYFLNWNSVNLGGPIELKELSCKVSGIRCVRSNVDLNDITAVLPVKFSCYHVPTLGYC